MEGNEAQELVAGLGGFLVKDPRPGKDACVQLVLDTGGDKLNILEYLKTEMLEDKRGDKDGVAGSIVSLFDHNISLNFEVMEDGTARAVPDTEADVTGPRPRAPGQEGAGGRPDRQAQELCLRGLQHRLRLDEGPGEAQRGAHWGEGPLSRRLGGRI